MSERHAALLDALDAALRGAGGEVELSAMHARQGTTRFAGSRVTQTGDVEDLVVQARVLDGGRLGAARTGALDAASIARAIAQAAAIAAAQKNPTPADAAPGFDDGSAPAPSRPDAWDAATAAAQADERARLVAPAFAETARAGHTAAGLALVTDGALAVATTSGARRSHRYTGSRLDVIASGPGSSGRVSRWSRALAPLVAEAPRLAADAVERAERGRSPAELGPGEYDVILEPAAVAELLEWLALTSLGVRAVEDGSSCLAGREGQAITGAVTLYDDALSGEDGCPVRPFDAEGTPTRRVTFLDGGVARGPVHDRASAGRSGGASTGHAPPLADDLFEGGPVPQHLQLAPGDDDVPSLLARVERGLWVSRFHYVNGLLDTRRALMTGMTRDGLFLIENGRVGAGVRNLRFTESLLEGLQRLGGITRERQVVAAGLSESVFVCPTVLVRRWRFTGASR